MLTDHQSSPVTFILANHQSLNSVWKLHISKISFNFPRGQWVKPHRLILIGICLHVCLPWESCLPKHHCAVCIKMKCPMSKWWINSFLLGVLWIISLYCRTRSQNLENSTIYCNSNPYCYDFSPQFPPYNTIPCWCMVIWDLHSSHFSLTPWPCWWPALPARSPTPCCSPSPREMSSAKTG